MRKISFLFSKLLFVALAFCLLQTGCGGSSGGGGGDDSPPPVITGDAVTGLYLVDGGHNSTPPDPLAGYALLDIDLNEGTGGNYIWLYYKLGKADGSEGEPVSRIYTVDEYDGETSQGGTKLPVNLNHNDFAEGGHEPLWLYYMKSDWPVVRCIVVYNASAGEMVYGPPEAEGEYDIVWVEELLPDQWKTPYADLPPDAQDLNEGQSIPFVYISDYIYIGYGRD